jgi:hypothetical protein
MIVEHVGETLKNEMSFDEDNNKSSSALPIISYFNYINQNILLKKCKILQLKHTLKSLKLHISGSKPVLIERLENHFKRVYSAIRIQTAFRRWIVLFVFRLRGPAFFNRSICVNDADFVTMEPLAEINTENFFSYTDDKQFTYGYNIVSLMQLIKNSNTKVCNPYNRERMSHGLISNIISVYNISFILFEEFRKENETVDSFQKETRIQRPQSRTVIAQQHHVIDLNVLDTGGANNQTTENETRQINLEVDYAPRVYNVQVLLDRDNYNRYQRIIQIRSTPVHRRVEELFIHFDQLGFYTSSSWFNELDTRNYMRLYRYLYAIWNYRSQMTDETRMKISPFYNPFEGIFNRLTQNMMNHENQMKMACLIVMENMVYSGVDEDHRKIGTFHVLTALTVVSLGARNAMPWLYESIL